MGIGIATALLLSERPYTVELVDVKDRVPGKELEALTKAKQKIASNLELLRDLGWLSSSTDELMSHLRLARGLEEVPGKCEFLFEALPEEPQTKQNFIRNIEPFTSQKTIIASATSTIDLDTLCKVSLRPANLITTHWLNPAFIIPLVEISVGEKTSNWVAEKTKSFLLEVGKVPVTLKSSPGFILPRIQAAAMNEAVRILEEGVASAEDIDTAMKAGFGFRLAVLGLIEFIDLGGVDVLYHASNYLYDALGRPHFRPPDSVKSKMKKKEIGPKTGKGFFDYSNVNVESMFKKRYRGFLELLELVKHSKVLDFYGGIEKRQDHQ